MDRLLFLLATGLARGAIFALFALSLVLIWRAARIINFAQGAMALVATYAAFAVAGLTGNYFAGLGAGLLAGALIGLFGVAPPLLDRAIGGAGGFAVLWLVAAGYRALRHREGMGGGDPKLFGAIGLWLGWRMLPVVLLLASLTGLAFVLARHVAGRRVRADDRLPFGALLAIAAYPAWLVMLALAA